MKQIEMDSPTIETTVNVKRLVPWISYLIFFAVLNETVFNVATPKIAEQFSLSLSGVSWIMTIFMIFFGICSVIYGKLSDIYSLKRLIVIGVIIYNLGSMIGFVFQSSYLLTVVARAVQGIGASAIPALIFVVVARYFPVAERGKIFGLITATVSFGIGLGPVIGGFVAGSLHWSFLFVIPLFTLISIPFLRKELPEEKRGEGSVDIIGAALVGLTIGALMVYLTFSTWYYLVVFILLLAGFLISIRITTNPFINPSLFKNRLFRNGVIVGFSLFSIVIGVLFVIPLMLHEIYGLSTSEIGLILFPGAISSVVFGPIGGNLADRKGNNFVVVIGLGLLIASFILISLLMTLSPWLVSASLLLLYVGFSLFQTALVNSVSQTLPAHKIGVGMGLFNLVSIISGAVGTALIGKILDSKWLAVRIFSVSGNPKAFAYCNVLILFSIVVILGGWLYLSSYQNVPKASQLIQE